MINLINARRRALTGSVPQYKLNFDNTYNEYLSLTSTYQLVGEFELEFNFNYSAVTGSYLCLFWGGGDSGTTRCLIQPSRFLLQVGQGSFVATNVPISYNTDHNFKLKRDSSGDIYYSLNGSTYALVSNQPNNGTIQVIGTESATGNNRNLIGDLKSFKLDTNDWQLNEGTGITVTSNTTLTATFETTGDLTHVNTESWELI